MLQLCQVCQLAIHLRLNLFISQLYMEKQSPGVLTQRAILQQEVQAARVRVSKIRQIESEINEVNGLMISKQQKTKNSQRQIRQMLPRKSQQRHSNSNRKIKIYELQKKLDARNKEYKEIHSGYIRKLQTQQRLLESISALDQLIKAERQSGVQLSRLEADTGLDVKMIEGQVEEAEKLLQQERAVLRIYQEEKVRKIRSIKILKRVLNLGSEKTEPDEESLVMSSEGDHHDRDQQQNEANNFMGELSRNEMRDLTEKEEFNDTRKRLVTFNDQKGNEEVSNLSVRAIEDTLAGLEEQINILKSKQSGKIETLGELKKHNRNLQASVKHARMTKILTSNQLNHYSKRIQELEKEILNSISHSERHSKRLEILNGERGNIRGLLGVKVENSRILSVINQEIQTDLNLVYTHSSQLNRLYQDAKRVVRGLVGAESECSDEQQEDRHEFS